MPRFNWSQIPWEQLILMKSNQGRWEDSLKQESIKRIEKNLDYEARILNEPASVRIAPPLTDKKIDIL